MNRKTVAVLQDLLSARSTITEFREELSDLLFDLRQDAAPNEEKAALSKIQLYLHEFDDGTRDIHEVYIATLSAMYDAKPSAKSAVTKTEKTTAPSLPIATTSTPSPDYADLTVPVA